MPAQRSEYPAQQHYLPSAVLVVTPLILLVPKDLHGWIPLTETVERVGKKGRHVSYFEYL